MIWTPRRALIALIVISAGLRLVWAAVLEPGNDEAYHHLYTLHPALSYFDHPPMMMWVESAGLWLAGTVTTFTIRLGFILMFAGTTWAMYRWTAHWYGEWPGFYAAFALNITGYFTAAAGVFVLPDGPLLFFSVLTMWALSEALVARPGRVLPWVGVGLAWGGALLSKYHAVFLPVSAVLYVVATPAARRVLRTPGPYLAVLLGCLVFSPVIVWNATHDWASFAFQGDRAVGMRFRPEGPLIVLGGQLGYLLPWIWVDMILVLLACWRIGRRSAGIGRLAVFLAMVPLVFFTVVSCFRETFPHWSLIGFVPLYPALGDKWWKKLVAGSRWMPRRLVIGVVVPVSIAIFWAAQAEYGFIRLKKEPTMEMSGWPSLAKELENRGILNEPNTFLFTTYWFTSGQLAYATDGRVPVLCYNPAAPHSFAYWSTPEQWVGQNGILVSLDDRHDESEGYAEYFRRIELIGAFPMTRHGSPFRTVRLYRCVDQLKPFPYRIERRAP
ncbi:MAG TPA: glycosyltransferase family 39 protein [Gemmataceae bacterium]|jgi:hypothetical protein|nr:glycosyltransferase family 39 protein [Gemmataceae bacterium]